MILTKLSRMISRLRSSTIEVEAVTPRHLEAAAGELLLTSRLPLAPGQAVRVTFPDGGASLARVSWCRGMEAGRSDGEMLLLSLKLEETDLSLAPERDPAPWPLRVSPRFDQRQWVRFDRKLKLGTVTLDLSVEGCRIAADLERHVGEIHSAILELPRGARSVRLQAKIIWSRRGESGLRFLNMHVEDETALAKSLGLPSSRPRDAWESLWRSSVQALCYRLTPTSETEALLDLEIPNWLASFTLTGWRAEGDWSGTFARLEVLHRTPQLTELQQEEGLRLCGGHPGIHLILRDSEGAPRLSIWGYERQFRRTARTAAALSLPTSSSLAEDLPPGR